MAATTPAKHKTLKRRTTTPIAICIVQQLCQSYPRSLDLTPQTHYTAS